jgi:CHAT domain
VKLPLDMKTVRQVLTIAREIYLRGEFSEGNLMSGVALGAISDTKWFGSGFRDWVTLWHPSSAPPRPTPDIQFPHVVLPVAYQLMQSGRRSQAARMFAAFLEVWPGANWEQFGRAGAVGFSTKASQSEYLQSWRRKDFGQVTMSRDLPLAASMVGSFLSLGDETDSLISYAEEVTESLVPKEPLLLTEVEIPVVANAVYDFHWSGRSEAAVRLSMALPRTEAASELYKKLAEGKGNPLSVSDNRIVRAVEIALGLDKKGYIAEGSNLFLDSLRLEDDSPRWNQLFKIVEPTVQLATTKPPKAIVSWARGVASRIGNKSPTASGPLSVEEIIMTQGTGSEGGGTAPPYDDSGDDTPTEPDPPRTAYALLKCEDAVVASVEFSLSVGLAKDPDADVSGAPKLERPASSVGPYTLQIQITADGFKLRPSESWRNELSVTAKDPYPSLTLHLTPEAQPLKTLWARGITAVYSIEGHTIGVATRSVAIAQSEEHLHNASQQIQDSSTTFSIPTDAVPPDLTVTITRGTSSGRLLWTLDTPWKAVPIPVDPLVVDVGEYDDGPKGYARQLIDSVNIHEGKPTLYKHLLGRGLEVGDLVPAQFWEVLRTVAQKSSHKIPTILILSAEPYVPWELAVLKPPLDPSLPPFLGAQAVVGRWVLANRGPKLPPPSEQRVKAIAVVSGRYDRLPGWRRLEQAESEADEIQKKWTAAPVPAETGPVLKCIDGVPPGDVLHFAMHGIYDPNSTLNGLVLVDGQPLDPTTVKGSTLSHTPFVFLNACQVGMGNTVLGDYSGMAAAFLYAGASGVIAPLWSIKDTIARQIALRFYEEAFQGTAPAEFLRSERSQFTDSPEVVSATFLAYQFFGHPEMRLTR